jgi:hypothetical protein
VSKGGTVIFVGVTVEKAQYLDLGKLAAAAMAVDRLVRPLSERPVGGMPKLSVQPMQRMRALWRFLHSGVAALTDLTIRRPTET